MTTTESRHIQHNIHAPAFLKSLPPYLLSVILFVCFKLIYPQPDIFLDSKNYMDWALDHFPVSYRPMGYSAFLGWLEGRDNNYITIVILQYATYLASCYFFASVIFRMFNFSRLFRIITYAITIYNPFAFFLVNLIAPDSFFLSFTGVWMGTVLLIFSGTRQFYVVLAVHLLSLYVLFELRYNALYYPLITFLSILTDRRNRKGYILAGTSVLLLTVVYFHTVERTRKFTSIPTFSGFAGWTLANNAIHIYEVTEVDEEIWESAEELMLHRYVLHFKDSIPAYEKGREVTTEYMWNNRSPLKLYAREQARKGLYPAYFIAWYGVSGLYADFGKKLILHYPFAFLRAFYLPNFISFFYPKLEAMERFDNYYTELDFRIQEYTGIYDAHLKPDETNIQYISMQVIRWLYLFINLLAIAAIVMVFAGIFRKRKVPAGIIIPALFYIVVLLLSVLGHPIVMRYMAVLLIFGNIFPLIYLSWDTKLFPKWSNKQKMPKP